ncbi:hypothetical protein ACM66B_000724 [Microbotryomycetes sp. NB124-2]
MQPPDGGGPQAWQQDSNSVYNYDADGNESAWRGLSLLIGQQAELVEQHHERQQQVDRRRTDHQLSTTEQLFEHWSLAQQPLVDPLQQRSGLAAAQAVNDDHQPHVTTAAASVYLPRRQLPPQQPLPQQHVYPAYNHDLVYNQQKWPVDAGGGWHSFPAAHVQQQLVASGVPGALPLSPTDTSLPLYPMHQSLPQQQHHQHPVHYQQQMSFAPDLSQPPPFQPYAPLPPSVPTSQQVAYENPAEMSVPTLKERQPWLSVTSSIWPADFAADSLKQNRPDNPRQTSSTSIDTASAYAPGPSSSNISVASYQGAFEQATLPPPRLAESSSRAPVSLQTTWPSHVVQRQFNSTTADTPDYAQSSRKPSVSNGLGTPRSVSGSDVSSQSRFASSEPPEASASNLPAPAQLVPVVDFAAANEALIGRQAAVTAAKRSKTRIKGKNKAGDEEQNEAVEGHTQVQHRPPRRGSRRSIADETVHCKSCGKLVATFILRGQLEDIEVPHVAVFRCLECFKAETSGIEGGGGEVEQQSAVDSTAKTEEKTMSFRKRHNKRVDQSSASRNPVTACDVCLRDIAAGCVIAKDSQATIDFHVEIVCASCDEKYQRCSDCGGGGGVRLGVGKWRSKQLFPPNRKTCSLSHARLGALSDMIYDVHFVGDIPPVELESVSSVCGKIFANTMFASLCIPEVLEQQHSIAKTYDEVAMMAMRGWQGLSPLLRHDTQRASNIRRYLAIRSCAPNPRKAKDSAPPPPVPPGAVVLRENKEVAGFVISEWDMDHGSVFLSVVVPWAMGEVYDATTILIQRMFRHISEDRDRMSRERQQNGLPPLAEVNETWTMMFFKRDSRMIQHLTKKRGFMFLEDYVKAYPETDVLRFPPTRPIYLPVERQQGWSVMVKRKPSDDPEFFPIRRTAQSAQVERKIKEQKARSRRAQASTESVIAPGEPEEG